MTVQFNALLLECWKMTFWQGERLVPVSARGNDRLQVAYRPDFRTEYDNVNELAALLRETTCSIACEHDGGVFAMSCTHPRRQTLRRVGASGRVIFSSTRVPILAASVLNSTKDMSVRNTR